MFKLFVLRANGTLEKPWLRLALVAAAFLLLIWVFGFTPRQKSEALTAIVQYGIPYVVAAVAGAVVGFITYNRDIWLVSTGAFIATAFVFQVVVPWTDDGPSTMLLNTLGYGVQRPALDYNPYDAKR